MSVSDWITLAILSGGGPFFWLVCHGYFAIQLWRNYGPSGRPIKQ